MSPIKPSLDRLVPALRRAASRVRGGHVVALSAVAVAAFGLVGLRAVDLPGPRPISDSDRLQIEIVQPVEPEMIAGSVMDVGELVDGFQGVPPPLPPLTEVGWASDEDWDDLGEGYGPRDEARRVAQVRRYDSRPEPERPSPVRAVQRWFGFDAPRRDYRAERAARRARFEAMERDRRAEDRFRREQADRYDSARRRAELRDAPPWRDDRRPPPERYERDDDRPSRDAWDDRRSPMEQGPRPYYADDRGPPPEWNDRRP